MGQVILVTGAASSGKSEWAETLAQQTDLVVTYLATAQSDAQDAEWQAKLEKHRCRRPSHWQTLEVERELGKEIVASAESSCLLVDSLGTWVANLLEVEDKTWEKTVEELVKNLQLAEGVVILVAEETGWGVIPAYATGRLFRNRLGNLTRRIGAIADTVYLVTGGYVLNLTQLGMPLQSTVNS